MSNIPFKILFRVCLKQYFFFLRFMLLRIWILQQIVSMFSLIAHQHSFTSKTFSGYQCYREIENTDSKHSTAATGERDRANLFCSSFCPLICLIFISTLLHKDKGTHTDFWALYKTGLSLRGGLALLSGLQLQLMSVFYIKVVCWYTGRISDVAKIVAVIFPSLSRPLLATGNARP